MIEFLLTILIYLLVLGLIWWVIDRVVIPMLPAPIGQVVRVILIVVLVIFVILILLNFVGGAGRLDFPRLRM